MATEPIIKNERVNDIPLGNLGSVKMVYDSTCTLQARIRGVLLCLTVNSKHWQV
jgi:hypothetical protein